jgi:tetratricopeptide (TPR) repeat protein
MLPGRKFGLPRCKGRPWPRRGSACGCYNERGRRGMKRACGLLVLLLAACELRGASLPRVILVFPFENQSVRPDLNWISESFAEMLSSRLSAADRYVLSRGERNAAYEQLEIPPGTPLTLASTYKVAEILGVDWAVTGSFAVEGDRLTARAQLLDVHRLKLAPALEATGELADLADLQTRLAWRLLATQDVGFTVGKEEDFARQFPQVRLDAFENYIRGFLATEAESRVRFLREADRLDPTDHRAALELGRHYFGEKDYGNSARWLRKLDKNDANYLESVFLLGVDEFFLGHDAAAEQAFGQLSQRIPLNEVWNNLGFMQARRGQYAEALTSFQCAYQGDPTDPVFCFNLGACLWYLKRYQEAAQYLGEAVRLAGDDTEAHTLLAVVLGDLGNTEGKQREFRWLAEHEGNSPSEIRPDLLPHLRLKKHYDGRAYRLLALAVRNARENKLEAEPAAQRGEAHLSRGKELLATGRWDEAERELLEALPLLPEASETHLVLAQVYEAQGRLQEATTELETCLKLRNTVAVNLHLARVYLSLDRPEAARSHGRAALKLEPDNHEAQELMEHIPPLSPASGKKP